MNEGLEVGSFKNTKYSSNGRDQNWMPRASERERVEPVSRGRLRQCTPFKKIKSPIILDARLTPLLESKTSKERNVVLFWDYGKRSLLAPSSKRKSQ